MDPTNNPTPTPTPNPGTDPEPAPAVNPETNAAPPSGAADVPVVEGLGVAPTPSTTSPAPAPTSSGTTMEPVLGGGISVSTTNGSATPPVNPIINPAGAGTDGPVNPVIQPSGVAATDAIMMPDPAPAPDPVEEELKAPMKAAAPAPGSIGSAVSGPADGAGEQPGANAEMFNNPKKAVPNVAFNDPATQPDDPTTAVAGAAPTAMAAKKNNKKTLIILIAVAAVVVVALAIVLVMQLMSGNTNTANTVNTNTSSSPVRENSNEEAETTPAALNTLSCTRNMTATEVVKYNDAIAGTIGVSAEFDTNDRLKAISLVEDVTFSDEDATNNEPVEMAVQEAEAADLTATSALKFYLPTDSAGKVELDKAKIQANYESLDFICELL